MVVVSPRVRPGCVWMPFHFPDQLTHDAGDDVTGTGEYTVCAVCLEALVPAAR